MNAFQKIAHFNTLIGNERGDSAHIRQQLAMIKEEFDELHEAVMAYADGADSINAGDFQPEEIFGTGGFGEGLRMIRDGMSDVVVTVVGLAHRLGVDIEADLEQVNDSNMSKFIASDEWPNVRELANEVAERLGITVTASENEPGLWALTSTFDATGNDGKFYPKGKLLKPSTFKEPSFI